MREIKQRYFKAFCKVEDGTRKFITNARDDRILCCTTCGFCKTRTKLDEEIKE